MEIDGEEFARLGSRLGGARGLVSCVLALIRFDNTI